jgi:hypothetical protein
MAVRPAAPWRSSLGPGLAICLLLVACRHTTDTPRWVRHFDYAPGSLHRIEIGDFGYPFVPVGFGRDTLWLPFDTGNMVGLTLESSKFAGLDLPCTDRRNLRDSAGRLTSSSCVAHGVEATVFGVKRDTLSIFEFQHESLPGLVGPAQLPGTRFTIDYAAGVLAADSGADVDTVTGFVAIPLVRSPRLPRLILVPGRVRGHDVLIEVDTGKSRTTIDRRLVGRLGLEAGPDGVSIGTVQLGPLTWTVDAARVVDTSGTSDGLPMPISIGLGSDLLAEFVFTVDYSNNRFWIPGS